MHAVCEGVLGDQRVRTHERARAQGNVVGNAGIDSEEAVVADGDVARQRHMRRNPDVVADDGPVSKVVPGPDHDVVSDRHVEIEALVIENEADHILVESEEAGGELYVSHSGDAPVGAQVKVAIRPEKVMISPTRPEQKRNVTKVVVRDIGYVGDVSIYHVELGSGKIVLATQPNVVRLAERAVT